MRTWHQKRQPDSDEAETTGSKKAKLNKQHKYKVKENYPLLIHFDLLCNIRDLNQLDFHITVQSFTQRKSIQMIVYDCF